MTRREKLESSQLWIYIITLILALGFGVIWSDTARYLTALINLILSILMFGMFTQIPFLQLPQALTNRKFFLTLMLMNFIIVPIIVWLLSRLLPNDHAILLGVFLVLLTPCIDYVIVFTHLGKGNMNIMLGATPLLFIVQMVMLPLYLWLFMGKEVATIIHIQPFIESFLFLIILPLLAALLLQVSTKKSSVANKVMSASAWLPVPFMALTLFVIVASQISHVLQSTEHIITVIPIYILFMIVTPIVAKGIGRLFKLSGEDGRTVAFSSSTRNSLVVLALALALPEPVKQIVVAVIVTQTIVEIVGELFYIKLIPKWIKDN